MKAFTIFHYGVINEQSGKWEKTKIKTEASRTGWDSEDKWSEKSQWTPSDEWKIRRRDVARARIGLNTFSLYLKFIADTWLQFSDCLKALTDIRSSIWRRFFAHAILFCYFFARNEKSQRNFSEKSFSTFHFSTVKLFLLHLCKNNENLLFLGKTSSENLRQFSHKFNQFFN